MNCYLLKQADKKIYTFIFSSFIKQINQFPDSLTKRGKDIDRTTASGHRRAIYRICLYLIFILTMKS